MTTRRTVLAPTIAASVALTAVLVAGPAAAITPTTTPSPTTTTAVPVIPRMPLTGVPLSFAQTVPRRAALVVKIDNATDARPQTGLNAADIVFEEIVEGNITRFAAVYQSQGANPVGPIRSGRTQDVDLLSSLGPALFVWSGGNPGVTRAIDDSDLISIPDGTAGLFYRDRGRRRPHNLYSNTDPVWAHYAWSIAPPEPLFEFVAPGTEAAGDPASFVELKMAGIPVRWDHDPATDRYARSQFGRAHQLVEGPASADNVVILLTDYRRSVADARSPEAITVGTGIAFVLSDGTLQIGTWRRDDNTSPITLLDSGGDPILLGPGRTWVELANAANHDTVTG